MGGHVLWGIQHNAEWRGHDDLARYILQQDSEKVSNNFIIKMTESDISLHAVIQTYFILHSNSSQTTEVGF